MKRVRGEEPDSKLPLTLPIVVQKYKRIRK